ncbi:hypothetical protein L228DRAFT_39755 [Xylona heveae TC161]|uniref:Uncharacterized protein n=1 Tax=Xylona heveae (strain CBS 132557 / TC161) TaxID=1328760 RepID=A0A164ZZC6_XYLHT|nr:hypothetical protein L228DRAFT_39755 [Xylona heveae TC161]KZF19737.1 hypothetical protein L228DRAFT_39755 [Xylona heveae TC161]
MGYLSLVFMHQCSRWCFLSRFYPLEKFTKMLHLNRISYLCLFFWYMAGEPRGGALSGGTTASLQVCNTAARKSGQGPDLDGTEISYHVSSQLLFFCQKKKKTSEPVTCNVFLFLFLFLFLPPIKRKKERKIYNLIERKNKNCNLNQLSIYAFHPLRLQITMGFHELPQVK